MTQILILSTIFAIITAIIESQFYYIKEEERILKFHKTTWNTHIPLVILRVFVWILIAYTIDVRIETRIIYVVAMWLMFSFWHNGTYYVMQYYYNSVHYGVAFHRLYIKRLFDNLLHYWTYQSPTSTAKYDLNFKQRTLSLISGIILLVLNPVILVILDGIYQLIIIVVNKIDQLILKLL